MQEIRELFDAIVNFENFFWKNFENYYIHTKLKLN